jgi:hypothetical protein
LRNENLQLAFKLVDGQDFQLVEVRQAGSPHNLIVQHSSPTFLWSILLVNETTNATIVSSNCTQSASAVERPNELDLHWDYVSAMQTTISVTMSISLPANETLAQVGFAIVNNNPQLNVGLWQYTVQVPGLPCGTDEFLFFPNGLGFEYINANETIDVSNSAVYPSSLATMQFMAAGGGPETQGQGVYVGIHDSQAYMKTLFATIYPQVNPMEADSNIVTESTADRSRHPDNNATTASSHSRDRTEAPSFNSSTTHSNPTHADNSSAFDCTSHSSKADDTVHYNTSLALGFTFLLENAGESWRTYTQPFKLTIGITPTTPLWYSASQIYREWVMSSSAAWLDAGPVASRQDMPDWLINNHLWFNTGWQCLDVFNNSEGNPHEVLERASTLR